MVITINNNNNNYNRGEGTERGQSGMTRGDATWRQEGGGFEKFGIAAGRRRRRHWVRRLKVNSIRKKYIYYFYNAQILYYVK